ncbi:hypothetical protein HZC32_02145, partial [Candidatus Woesearchaeota archaeon]|nr:hypothetical protein [Candidatus Woesearchaeota archaeon]
MRDETKEQINMTTILDWLENDIVCPTEIEKALSQKSKEKREFYGNYVSSLEQIVGFKPEEQLFAEVEGARNWIELFNWTEREFNRHPFPKEAFNSYAQFFNSFFVHPYGIRYQEGQFVDTLEVEQTTDKDRNRKNRGIVEYVRRINLPLLLYLSVQEHERKHSLLEPLNEIIGKEAILITYRDGKSKRKIKGNLRATFDTNYWKNIFSSSEDCIFITHDKAKAQLTFRDYWFASLGHMLHPAVYYLNFEADSDKDSKELGERFPCPLFKAILMETSSEQYPLLVEGVLGARADRVKIESNRFNGICDLVDFTIWQFFGGKYQASYSESELFYFPAHGSKTGKLYYNFDESTKGKYPLGKPMVQKPLLEVVCDERLARIISNVGVDRPFELFSEAFAHSNPVSKR